MAALQVPQHPATTLSATAIKTANALDKLNPERTTDIANWRVVRAAGMHFLPRDRHPRVWAFLVRTGDLAPDEGEMGNGSRQ